MTVPVVASVIPTTAVPHPPWFAAGATGLVWLRDSADAAAFRVAMQNVLRLPRSSGWWSQPIVGPVPSGGVSGDAVSSATTAGMDALL